MDGGRRVQAGSRRQIRGVLTVRLDSWPYGRQVSNFTLPGKTSKESTRCPYHKPTQVDEVNIHRRSRERLLRN